MSVRYRRVETCSHGVSHASAWSLKPKENFPSTTMVSAGSGQLVDAEFDPYVLLLTRPQ